ncbi:ParB/RepB/Spo0J family partition protein [Meiothermus granaticius]|uniref:Chromosome-partitioning protein Spo0J n=1 Tax=Meiothermus granaticius NBRC 107808 TaxID=1227551 RepID=A0A399FET5_9DEIN|nr:ParB/RepB/Spo0J family partition protein [Meiothermus granaticius]MCL6528397.1 ParB/RepB/Spo0J family partition protein [Thermaceae bacterium]RIH93531.1 Chromosome-partitioning protein Spo0J [Meiothermus granaticius NBRC 107808]GEM86027.1 hypothetical protein MGR01S_06520 [Meiothermus granaticius NBRC 107808]
MSTVKLSQLKLGPNVRKTYKPDAIAEMADSIKAVGVLQNLLVRPARKGYEVVFGGRRYKALQMLLKAGQIAKDYQVPVEIRKLDDAEAARLGLIENLFREDMEPLEEAEAFYELVQKGISVADLALQTGFSERLIRQRITLAERLHPQVKELLREDGLTLEQAQTLTLVDPEDQVALLENWGEDFDPDALRLSLRHSVLTVGNAVFTLSQYEGAIVEDLFGDAEAHFADQAQARRLQLEAVALIKAKLEAQGFDPVTLLQQHGLPRWAFRAPTEGEGKGGAVVNVHPNTLKVEVLEGVVSSQPTPPTVSMPGPRGAGSGVGGGEEPRPRPPLTRKGAAQAKNLKSLALQRALLGGQGGIHAALALAVLGLLGEREVYLHDSRERSSDDKGLLDPAARAVQERFVSRLPQTRMGEGGLELGVSGDALAVFKALAELPRGELEALFVALLAGRIGSWNERYSYQPTTRDSHLAVGLAQHLGAQLAWKDVPPEFWQSFSKERVAGIVGDFDPAYAHIPFSSRKEAVGTLLELAKVKPEQPLPEELQFQSHSAGVQQMPPVAEEAQGEELEAA